MPDATGAAGPFFLSTLSASRRELRLAGAVVALSLAIFAILAPFAKTPLLPVWAFIPGYESSLVVIDLVTAVLLFSQFFTVNSRALLVLGSGYVFTAAMTVAHAFTFPGLFAEGGLLGAGAQSTAWLYMLWHGGFPLFVTAYALLKDRGGEVRLAARHPLFSVGIVVSAVLAVVIGFAVLATQGQALLPPIMDGNHYTALMIVVVSLVWMLSLAALVVLALHRPYSVLDVWLMVVMCAWMIDIALSAVLNQGRFDLGFYAGRIYGLLAASFVLLVLLAESGMLYKKLVQLTNVLQQMTTQDSLTGIANRRAFDGALDLEWRHALRSGEPLSLMMIDVDHFKIYNDSYGHPAGDGCLRAVAQALKSVVTRNTDLLARYGGEEFAVLLSHTDAASAARVAERLRLAVATLGIRNDAVDAGYVTISIGVACVRSSRVGARLNSTALVEMADQELYAAKAAGRNRVAVRDSLDPAVA